jgi:uncharacterized protein YjbJ (UPF0337 family)
MNNQEAEGKRKKVEGQVRETVGSAVGDKSEQIRGKGEQIQGDVQEGLGKAKRKIENSA